MPYREDFGPLAGAPPTFQDETANDPYLQQDPNAAAFAPSSKPWYLRQLEKMKSAREQGHRGPQQQPNGDPVVNAWSSFGAGVGNVAKKLIGLEHGGAVQGPTMALIGEGGEPEYVIPESKVAPWIARYLLEGVPSNPATVDRREPPPPVILPPQVSERAGTRPPPPVILPPRMACGGKVMPRMAAGGMVLPRPVGQPMTDETDYFNVGLPAPSIYSAPDLTGSLPPQVPPPVATLPTPPARRSLPAGPQSSFEARRRLADMTAKGGPQPKWYERLVGTPPGDGPIDMRPGVAGWSMAGRAARGVLSSVLPFGRKREQFGREYNAAQMDAEIEAAQNAAAQKQYQAEIERTKAEDALATNESTRARNAAQTTKAEADAKKAGQRQLRSADYTNNETGDVTRVWSDASTGDEVKREVLPGVAKPKPTAPPRPQALTIREVTDASGNVRRDFYNPDGTLDHTENLPKAGKPMRPTGDGSAGSSPLSEAEETLAKGIAEGKYLPTAATGKRKTAILARASELGYAGGTQSASDAKIGGIVETLPNELEKIRQIIKSGYRTAIAGYQSGANRELVRLIDNAADKVGRLRSGGAINKDEEARFIRQLGMEKGDLIMGDSAAAESAIDGVLAESNAVKSRMKPGRQQGVPAAGASQAASPEMVKMKFPNGKTMVVKPENVKAAEAAGAKRI